MTPHPFLKAYMAALVVPTLLLLMLFGLFLAGRAAGTVPATLDRVIAFPLAIAPAAWGLWNILFVALGSRRHWSIGMHGATLPILLAPIAAFGARSLGLIDSSDYWMFVIVLPGVMLIYFLLWKYCVGYLNRLLGIG